MPSPSASPPGKRPSPGNGQRLRDRLFAGVARLALNHPWLVLAVFVGLAGLAVWYIQDFPIRTAYLDLLPQRDPLVEKFRLIEQELSSTDVVAILLTLTRPPASPEERVQRLTAGADRIAANLNQPTFVRASYKLGEGIPTPSEILFLRTLSPPELSRLAAIAKELETRWLGQGFTLPSPAQVEEELRSQDPARVRAALHNLQDAGTKGLQFLEGLPKDQALLAEAAGLIRLARERGLPQDEGYPIVSADRTMLVLQVWPARKPYESLAFNKEVIQLVQAAIKQANLEAQGITATLAGPYAYIVETDRAIREDMSRVTLISSIAVLVIVFLTFTSLFLAVVALVPMVVSILLTMAWAKFAVGGFNLITVFLPALVLGLGIDYTLHLLARYTEERGVGRGVTAATATAVRTKGEACFTAALTTAAVFACLLVSHSRALWEMGVIMAVAIFASLATALLLTPGLLAVALRRARRLNRAPSAGRPSPLGQALSKIRDVLLWERPAAQPQALRAFYRRFLALRWGIVAVTLTLAFALAYQAAQVEFRFVSAQLAPPTRSAEALQVLAKEFAGELPLGDAFRFFVPRLEDIPPLQAKLLTHPLVITTRSARDLLPHELARGMPPLGAAPLATAEAVLADTLARVNDWGTLVDQLDRLVGLCAQGELLAILSGRTELAAAFAEGTEEVNDLRGNVAKLDREKTLDTLASTKAQLPTIQKFVEDLQALPPESELLAQILAVLPEEVRTQYMTKTGLYVVEARLKPGLYEGKNLQAFIRWCEGLGVERFGVPEVTAKLEAYMRRDFALSTALAVLVIFLLVLRDFPRLKDTLLALSPLGLGYVWMLAGMRLMGIQFNFTNIVISPLLIGIGVDSALHLLHRVGEEVPRGGDAVARASAASGLPILASSLTTIAAFAALLVAQTPGLRMLGTSALLGLGFTLLWSITFLPAAASLSVEKVLARE